MLSKYDNVKKYCLSKDPAIKQMCAEYGICCGSNPACSALLEQKEKLEDELKKVKQQIKGIS